MEMRMKFNPWKIFVFGFFICLVASVVAGPVLATMLGQDTTVSSLTVKMILEENYLFAGNAAGLDQALHAASTSMDSQAFLAHGWCKAGNEVASYEVTVIGTTNPNSNLAGEIAFLVVIENNRNEVAAINNIAEQTNAFTEENPAIVYILFITLTDEASYNTVPATYCFPNGWNLAVIKC